MIMEKKYPYRKYIFPTPQEGVGFLFCARMKAITFEKLYLALKEEKYEIRLPKEIIEKARKPIEKMLELSR